MSLLKSTVRRADAGGGGRRQPAGHAPHVVLAALGAVVGDGVAAPLLGPSGGAAPPYYVTLEHGVRPLKPRTDNGLASQARMQACNFQLKALQTEACDLTPKHGLIVSRGSCRHKSTWQVFPAAGSVDEPPALSSGAQSPGLSRRPVGMGAALQEHFVALVLGAGCAPGGLYVMQQTCCAAVIFR